MNESIDICNDDPIQSPCEDLYGRAMFADRVADCIIRAEATESAFVIGLEGPWGSGKTSLLNLVEIRLTQMRETDLSVPEIMRFNPWRFGSQEQLLTAFFGALSKKLRGNADQLRKGGEALGTALSDYSASMSYPSAAAFAAAAMSVAAAPIAGGGILFGLLAKPLISCLGKRLKALGSPDEMKEQIDSYLKKRTANLIVMIDDIDRLSDEEICLMFKLVALTASFPHVVYVLSYDRVVVGGALDRIQKSGGALYLEKVVQLSIEMPRLLPADVAKQVNLLTQQIDSKNDVRRPANCEGRKRSARINRQIVAPLVTRPRDVRRLRNGVESNLARTRGEICTSDLLAMSAIQVMAPDLYAWIWNNADRLLDMSGLASRQDGEEQLRHELGEFLRHSPRGSSLTLEALGLLFPVLLPSPQGSLLYNPGKAEVRTAGWICCRDLLNLFYGVRLDSGISSGELERLCFSATADEVANAFCRLASDAERAELVGQMILFADAISDRRCEVLAQSILILLGECTGEKCYVFNDVGEVYARLLKVLGQKMGVPRFGDWLRCAVDSIGGNAPNGLVLPLRDERLARERDDDQKAFTGVQYEELVRVFSNWMHDNYREQLEKANRNAFTMWRALDEELSGINRREFVKDLNEDEECRILYGTQQMSVSQSLSDGELLFGSFASGDKELEPAVLSAVWQCPWYRKLSRMAKEFIAAYVIKSGRPELSEGGIAETEVLKLVKQWDDLVDGRDVAEQEPR